METIKIKVFDVTGRYGTDENDATPIYALVSKHLKQGDSVELDFSGVQLLLTIFLNTAIGQLYKSFDADLLKEKLIITGLSKYNIETVDAVRDNATRYYASCYPKQELGDELLKNNKLCKVQ